MKKCVIVTGAARGIGRAISMACLRYGWEVVAVDVDYKRLMAEFGDIPSAHVIAGSVHSESVEVLIRRLEENDVDYCGLVNNVGVTAERNWSNVELGDMEHTFAVNVIGPWSLTKWWAARAVTRGHRASSIFVTSLHTVHVRLFPDYSMSKAAIGQLIREGAVALAGDGIRINGLQPGAIDTWSDVIDSQSRDEASSKIIPLGRLGVPADLEEAALFLLDDDKSGYVTGTQITVDGGLGLRNWILELPPEDS